MSEPWIWHFMDDKTVHGHGPWVRKADHDAAIEALQAENARLREELQRYATWMMQCPTVSDEIRRALGDDADDLSVCKDRELEDEISWEELWGDDNG